MSWQHAQLSDVSFKKALESPVPVLVDFCGDNCVPCRMIEPLVDGIRSKYGSKLKVYKANIKDCAKTAGRYSIKSIPTLMLFKKGAVALRFTGVVSSSVLNSRIEEHIAYPDAARV